MRVKHLLIFALIAALNRELSAGELQLTVSVTKTNWRVGDKVRFDLTFRNVSEHTIQLFPDPELNYTSAIVVFSTRNKEAVEEFELGERSMDERAWARDVVTLASSQSYTKRLTLDVRKNLPEDWRKFASAEWRANSPEMPLLIFLGGSALRLPSFGEYDIRAKYEFGHDHPVVKYIPNHPKLWFGTLQSAPVRIRVER